MKVVVVGGNFAGMTAALEVKRKLGKDAEVMVVDRSDNFLFVPSWKTRNGLSYLP